MIRLSTGLKSAMLTDSGLASLLYGGRLRFYTGAQPDSADLPPTGTLLAFIEPVKTSLVDLGRLGLAEPHLVKGVDTGLMGWFRWEWTTDTGGISSYYPRLDGDANDFILVDYNFTPDTSFYVQDFVLTM